MTRRVQVTRINDYDWEMQGYAATYEPYPWSGPDCNDWTEEITRGAFEQALKQGPDMFLELNFEGMPWARTRSGSMQLRTDDTGLWVTARVHREILAVEELKHWQLDLISGEPQILPEPIELTIQFRAKDQEWSGTVPRTAHEPSHRKITAIDFHKCAIGISDPQHPVSGMEEYRRGK